MIPNELEIIENVRKLDYPTPFFYTSQEILKHNYQTFIHLFDNEEIYYAVKANSDPRILMYLNQLGCGFEAASAFEIDVLIGIGVSPHKIVYGTAVKPASHIEHAFKLGINRFAADSKEELEKVAKAAPGAKIFVRAIVDDSGSVFTMSDRFGAPIGEVEELMLYARKLGLKTYGMSFYVGSQATQSNKWANGVKTVRPVVEKLYEQGIKLEMINIGGGFPVLYNNHKDVPHLKEIVTLVNKELRKLPYKPKIIMEPGRGIVASSTVMVAEIISKTTRRNKTWLCLDAGIYNALYEAMMHQGSTQYNVHPQEVLESDKEIIECTLAGPTGDSLDIITHHAELPSHLKVGDRLIFENTGAYTITMASAFNGFPKPELYIG